jgi:hypothetical protein
MSYRPDRLVAGAIVAVGLLAAAFPARAGEEPPVAPAPSPPPVGSMRWSLDAHATFITQGTRGPGTLPLEAAGFSAGNPLAPLTPYDTFSSAPLLPGNAGEAGLLLTPTYYGRRFDASVTFGAAFVRGSISNAVYWGESLLPALNPHIGAQQLPYAVSFPTHAGGDDGTGFVASIVSGSIASKDGNLRLRAGWFDLAQSDGFVFAQPAIVSAIPGLGIVQAESLGGLPSADWWTVPSTVYPLHGLDLTLKRGTATLELTDATLPSLPGTAARLRMGSLVFDRGEGTRFSAQAAQVVTGGALVPTTVLFATGSLTSTPQGLLPTGTIGGQNQTIFGLRGAFHVRPNLDAVAEVGRSTYTAQNVSLPGTGRPGSYYHAGLAWTLRRSMLALDGYRNDPYYATAILPYGIAENVWSVAWSWPGQWLKSNYQLINNLPVNVDRQGYRLKYALTGGPFEFRAAYANFGEIEPITIDNALQTGFVDGFFLPQPNAAPTLGRQRQYALWAAWHAPFAHLVVDYTEDTMRRKAAPSSPQDHVSYDTPEFSVYAWRRLSPAAVVAAGFARYGMRGSFGQPYTNIDFAQRIWFASAQLRQSSALSTLVTLRRSTFGGIPSQLAGPSPDFAGTMLIVEQRFKL